MAPVALQRPNQHLAIDEFGFAPAAIGLVPGLVDETKNFLALRVGQTGCERALAFRSAGIGIHHGRGILDCGRENGVEKLRRVEAAQFDDLGAVGCEDDGGGPAPALIALRDIRPAVLVDVDRDELVFQDCAYLGAGPGLVVHHVAPSAPP